MTFSPITLDDDDDDNGGKDIASALKYGIRAYVAQNSLQSAADLLFGKPGQREALAEQRLKNRLLARELGISEDELEEMMDGPSIPKRAAKALPLNLAMQALRVK